MTYQLTNKQARQFLLAKHGLLNNYKFTGKQGVLDFVKQAGCIQFDPIDVCGKNPELVLQSRVKGFTKQMLYDILYTDRQLVDYFDKNLAIINITDWKYFSATRERHKQRGRSHSEVNTVCEEIKSIIKTNGAICSSDLQFDNNVSWYWSDTKLSRAALESLYFRGELGIHHKKGTRKYYDLIENCLPHEVLTAANPLENEFAYMKWNILRRISSVGMLWNKASDAWLCIHNLKTRERSEIFSQLLTEKQIIEISVENIADKLYCPAADSDILEYVQTDPKCTKRCELLAPLDNFLWDRKLIKAIFHFDYKWEIYTPENQRKYGYYVLPLLWGDKLIGRVEAVNDKKTKSLYIKNIWFEPNIKPTKKLLSSLNSCFKRFARFNLCEQIINESRNSADGY